MLRTTAGHLKPLLGEVVFLIDGRAELVAEVAAAPSELRNYISRCLQAFSEHVEFDNGIEGTLPAGPEVRQRVDEVIWPRVRELIGGFA